MSFKDLIKEVEDATEDMVLSKDSGEHASPAEIKEKVSELVGDIGTKVHEIEDATDEVLGLDQSDHHIGEKIGDLAKEVGDASDVMISGEAKKED